MPALLTREVVLSPHQLWSMQDLRMPGPHVDVNVHPTKREVGFLHQEALIDALRTAVEEKLLVSNDRCAYGPAQHAVGTRGAQTCRGFCVHDGLQLWLGSDSWRAATMLTHT